MGYNIGVDIGTHSCGTAAIGEDFTLKKFKGKNVWGAVKFDEGQTAKERRLFRGARRLNTRRKRRIRLFREIIEPTILEVDSTFFHRLEDSFKHMADKRYSNIKYNLFIDRDFTDVDYFRNYPTIYHLRKRLIIDDSKCDIRLVYLAIHHMLKYRGNFISEGQTFSEISSNGTRLLDELFELITNKLEVNINLDSREVFMILDNKKKSKKDKLINIDNLCKLGNFTKETKALAKEIFSGIIGLQMNLSKVFIDTSFDDKEKVKLSDSNVDEKLVAIADILGEDYIIVEKIKEIYSGIQLKEILGENKYISEAMIEKYKCFKEDLMILKKVIKSNCNEKVYYDIFKNIENDIPSYKNYMNISIKVKGGIEENRKAFYDKIKKSLSEAEGEDVNYILKRIEEEKFLIKLNTTENSIIPYQLHEMELRKVLENQGKYYKALRENKDKIIQILTFRIPYYVGPLGKNGDFKWLIRNEGQDKTKILPWNFEKVVNINETAKEFIERMTNYCSYLPDKKVLPFNSILYTQYLYYNEINKIEFNGNKLDSEMKEKLKEEVFMKHNNVTEKRLMEWYLRETSNSFTTVEVTKLQGDGKANVTLKPIRDFKRIYGNITSENIDEIETIIYWLTVYEDKKIVERRIKSELNVPESKLKEILKLNYKGWGKYSKELLQGIKVTREGEKRSSIIDILIHTNLNFMQIINDDILGFNRIIDKVNGEEKIDKVNFEKHIKTLQGSPSLKKGIGQAVKQIEEVISAMGELPQNIFIEFAREDQESKRTIARRDKLLALYEEFEEYVDEDKDIVRRLKDKKTKIDSEKIYLYYIQRGKCMYTQRPLTFGELDKYEVDHIIPRSIIKDDSLSNKVLVIKRANQEKSADKLRNEIIDKNTKWWSELLKYNLISKRKYENLTNRSQSFSVNMEKDFINRQLVELRQISKHVTNLLRRAYGYRGVNIVAIKSTLVNDFKSQYQVYKSREVNDLHHAKDAYVTAVVGQYLMMRYPKMRAEFIYDDFIKYKRESTGRDKFGFVISSMNHNYVDEDTGEVLWTANERISNILKVLRYNDCIITKKTEIMSGGMFNLTRMPKSDKSIDNVVPLKNNKNLYLAPEKYGYYIGIQEAYYAIIEYTLKKKRIKRLVGIPIMIEAKIKGSKELLKEFLAEKYEDVVVIKARVPKYQKIRYEGHEYYIVSSNEWCNAKQLILPQNIYDNICIANDPMAFIKKKESEKEAILLEIYDSLVKKLKNQYEAYKSTVIKLDSSRENFERLTISDKIRVVNEILNMTKANSQCANLKLVGGAERVGRLSGKDTVDVNKLTFIYESPLGINKREVRY